MNLRVNYKIHKLPRSNIRNRNLRRHPWRGEVAWVLGSVAEKVISHASMPVLLMRVIEAKPIIEKRHLPEVRI